MNCYRSRYGASLIELLVIIAILAIVLPALSLALISTREGTVQHEKRLRAATLLQETQEALRTIRESGWSNISTNGIYHPEKTNKSWTLISGTDTVDGITRSIAISSVNRLNNAIVTNGGTLDPSTKKIIIQLTWSTPISTTLQNTIYMTRFMDNATYTQTTQNEFNTGTLNGVITTNNNGGEVSLGAGGQGSWCSPQLAVANLDLPKNGVANAISAIEGNLFAGTGDNASGVSYAHVNISNTNPPVATIKKTFDGYKTNDVFGDQTYGYLATDSNSEEIVIINLDTASKVGWFNAPGSNSVNNVYVYGNYGYLIQGSTFRIFDLTSKNGARSQTGSVNLAGTGTSLVVSGNYAYVSISGSTTKLQIIDVSTASTPTIVGQVVNINSQNAKNITINKTSTRAYLVTESSSNQNELFIIDISTKTGNRSVLGSYDTNGMNPTAVTLVPGNIVIAVGIGAEEYQVINISSESNPARCGGVQVDSGINDISSVLEADGDAYSYILTRDSNQELRIIEGGPGGYYSTGGIYESPTFTLGYPTAFNRFIPNYIQPNGTVLRFQIGITDAVNGSCTGVNYVFTGPDGTTDTWYTASSSIFFNDDNSGYENPAQCLRYRAHFSSNDVFSTAILEDVTINYSP